MKMTTLKTLERAAANNQRKILIQCYHSSNYNARCLRTDVTFFEEDGRIQFLYNGGSNFFLNHDYNSISLSKIGHHESFYSSEGANCKFVTRLKICPYCFSGFSKWTDDDGERFWKHREIWSTVSLKSAQSTFNELFESGFDYGLSFQPCGCVATKKDECRWWGNMVNRNLLHPLFGLAKKHERFLIEEATTEFINARFPRKSRIPAVKKSEISFFQMVNSAAQLTKQLATV